MSKFARSSAALFAIALLAGCADMGNVPANLQVTRFHLNQPVARGEIAVEAANTADQNSLEFQAISAPVERELSRLGWTVSHGNGRTEQVAMVHLDQDAHEAPRTSGLSFGVGVGAGSGGYGYHHGGTAGAVGVGATIPVSGNTPNLVIASHLSVRIQRRSDATVFWEGRAEMQARGGSEFAGKAAAADRLAAALFRDFPGESGRTIRVR
jgi:hypothetical protein